MAPIKTVLLLQDLLCGGTQRHTLELAKRLDPKRFDTHIWTLVQGGDFLPEALACGLRVRQLAKASAVGPASLWGLWRALREERPDIVMALTVTPNIWGRVLGGLAKVPLVVANCRGADDLWRQHERVLKNCAAHHICNARMLAEALSRTYGLPERRITVIPTGVDVARFSPQPTPPQGDPVVLCLARLAPVKDHATLISAFEHALPRCPGARLRIVGDGPLAESLGLRVRQSPARERIELLPGCPDPREHYAQASLAALSSVSEGMPNTLLEAMACGLAVAATDVGGVGELVEQGRTGLLAPARDPVALGQALAALMADTDLRARMGRAGRERAVALHGLDQVAARHAELLVRLASSTGL